MAFELLKTCLFSKINTTFLEVEEQINFIGTKSSGLKLATGVVIIHFITTHRKPKLALNIKLINRIVPFNPTLEIALKEFEKRAFWQTNFQSPLTLL